MVYGPYIKHLQGSFLKDFFFFNGRSEKKNTTKPNKQAITKRRKQQRNNKQKQDKRKTKIQKHKKTTKFHYNYFYVSGPNIYIISYFWKVDIATL